MHNVRDIPGRRPRHTRWLAVIVGRVTAGFSPQWGERCGARIVTNTHRRSVLAAVCRTDFELCKVNHLVDNAGVEYHGGELLGLGWQLKGSFESAILA